MVDAHLLGEVVEIDLIGGVTGKDKAAVGDQACCESQLELDIGIGSSAHDGAVSKWFDWARGPPGYVAAAMISLWT